MSEKNVRDVADRNDTDPSANCIASGAPERLREAAKLSGGISTLATRSGIPLGSLNHYLKGREMRRDVLVAIADATGVSIEWLATGRGDMWSAAHRELMSIRMHEPSPDGKTVRRTKEYEDFLERQATRAASGGAMEARNLPSQSQTQSAVREPISQPIIPPPTIDVGLLKQAMEIVRAIGGPNSLDDERAPNQIAAAYDILVGAKQ